MTLPREKTKNDQEREANLFAMCLLMPENMVRKEVAKLMKAGTIDLCGDDAFIKSLAKTFAVTETLVVCRLIDLGIILGA